MHRSFIITAFVISTCLDGFTGQDILSVSVQWIPVTYNKIRFTYHIAWKQTPIQNCPLPNTAAQCYSLLDGKSFAKAGFLYKLTGSYRWECERGCKAQQAVTNLSGLYYKNISTFKGISWASGVETATVDFGPNESSQTVVFRFYRPDGLPVDGIGAVEFDRSIRQDTSRANIGPVVTPLPFYNIPVGEVYQIHLHPYDGDGDKVRCKLGTNTSSTSILLDEVNCVVHVNTKMKGVYRPGQEVHLSLFTEDYSCKPVLFGSSPRNQTTGPFSRSPFMITLFIGAAIRVTSAKLRYDVILGQNPVTLLNLPIRNFKTQFGVSRTSLGNYLATGPRFMRFKANFDTSTIEAVWNTGLELAMNGIHQACVMTYDSNGMPSTETKCAIFYVGAEDKCRRNPCQGRGLCRTWYNHYTCVLGETSKTCPKDSESEFDFLKRYIHYLIYGGCGVACLMLLLLLLCICQRCYAGREPKSKKRKRNITKIRPQFPDSEW